MRKRSASHHAPLRRRYTRFGPAAPAPAPAAMPGRPHWPKALVREVYAKTDGHCHHCGVALPWTEGRPRTWHIDHFPVAYRDIESQVCFGVRDPRDPRNLVPSCAKCNMSHAHERDVCCGHTQLRCKRQWLLRGALALVWAASVAIGFACGLEAGA